MASVFDAQIVRYLTSSDFLDQYRRQKAYYVSEGELVVELPGNDWTKPKFYFPREEVRVNINELDGRKLVLLLLRDQPTVPAATFEKVNADFTKQLAELQALVKENIQLFGDAERKALTEVDTDLIEKNVRRSLQAQLDELQTKLDIANKEITELKALR